MSGAGTAGEPRRQCGKCPWRVDVDPRDIPGGYCETKHRGLASCIAEEGRLDRTLRAMACHESKSGKEIECVGWLVHQLGHGNNLGLRLAVMAGRVSGNVETVGAQHERFEDTLPTPGYMKVRARAAARWAKGGVR